MPCLPRSGPGTRIFRACVPHAGMGLPAAAALWRRRVDPQDLFIREIRSSSRSGTICAARRWGRRPALRCIDSGPVQFNLCSTAHQLLLLFSVSSVLSGLSVLKSEKAKHREQKESQRATEKSRCIPQALLGGSGVLGFGADTAFDFAYASPIARK